LVAALVSLVEGTRQGHRVDVDQGRPSHHPLGRRHIAHGVTRFHGEHMLQHLEDVVLDTSHQVGQLNKLFDVVVVLAHLLEHFGDVCDLH